MSILKRFVHKTIKLLNFSYLQDLTLAGTYTCKSSNGTYEEFGVDVSGSWKEIYNILFIIIIKMKYFLEIVYNYQIKLYTHIIYLSIFTDSM